MLIARDDLGILGTDETGTRGDQTSATQSRCSLIMNPEQSSTIDHDKKPLIENSPLGLIKILHRLIYPR